MVLDLRFIPDEMQFSRPPRDTATELPPKYSAPAFSCSALQQSKVKLSWDADDAERTKVRGGMSVGRIKGGGKGRTGRGGGREMSS
jgi:hypothetical protein